MSNLAIAAQGLSRRFGDILAVDGMDLEVGYGEIFGYLGANGAGKSTTIRMLTGILEPTGGAAQVAGFDVDKDAERVKASIGYVSQKFSLYADLTVRENLEFYGSVYGITRKTLGERLSQVLERTGLASRRGQLAATLSGGWKQRLALANAILHRPRILFLDEPTAGLDPVSRRSLWELLYELAGEGVALFVTTHYMEEAERCNQIAIISQGRLLQKGKPEELKSALPGHVLEIECSPLLKCSRLFQEVPGVLRVTAYGTTLHVNVRSLEEAKPLLLAAARRSGAEVSSVKPIPPSLEDVFALIA